MSLADAAGSDFPGWPVALDGPCLGLVMDGTSRLYVACEPSDGPMVLGFDSAGVALGGWPVGLPDAIAWNTWNDFSGICGRQQTPLAADAQGTVYIATLRPDEASPVRSLHAFGPDGKEREGWPQQLPGGDNVFGCGGFALAPDGTIRAWGYEGPPTVVIELGYGPFAERTVFTALGPDGTTLPGWPFGSTGTGSGPLIGADGTLYHLTEGGNLWAHGPDGEPRSGWPYRTQETLATPYLSPDGRIVLIGNSGEITALGPDGAVVSGWPRRLLVSRASATVYTGDIDGFSQMEPAFGPDGTLYLALAPIADGLGGSILAFGPDGAMSPGWPFQLPDQTHVAGLSIDGAGNVVVGTATCTDPCWETVEFGSIVVSPQGTTGG